MKVLVTITYDEFLPFVYNTGGFDGNEPTARNTFLNAKYADKKSADNILKYFLIFPENRLWHFMQIVAYAQADLRWAHKSEGMFSDVAAQMLTWRDYWRTG